MCCRDRDEDGPDTLSEDEEEDDAGEVTSEEGKTVPPNPSPSSSPHSSLSET